MSDTNKPGAEAPADDHVPDADDDFAAYDDRSVSPADHNDPQAGARPAPRKEGESADDDPREIAVRRYREIRDQQAKDFAEQQARQAEEMEAGPDDEQGHQEERRTEPQGQRVKLKVHGREIEMSMEEALAHAQKSVAGENKLDEAKQLVAELKALKASQRGHQEESQAQRRPHDESRREKLLRAAERLQVGDAEDGAEALAELMPDESDIDRRVERKIKATRVQEEVDRAIDGFSRKNADIVNNKYLATAAGDILAEKLAGELTRAGVDSDIVSRLASNPKLLAESYKEARMAGWKIRDPGALMDEAATALRREFNIPAPRQGASQQRADGDRVQDRIERKRAFGTQQPRTAYVRQPMPTRQEPRTAKDIVGAMRKARGFNPTR